MLNYSNFHIVYIDDYFFDKDDAYKIYEWVDTNIKIK